MLNSDSVLWTVALFVAILVALVNQILLPAPWHHSINLVPAVALSSRPISASRHCPANLGTRSTGGRH